MKTRMIGVDAPEWMSFLADAAHDFYHLPRYAALCATQERGEPLALHAADAGNSLLLPLIVRGIPDSRLRRHVALRVPGTSDQRTR